MAVLYHKLPGSHKVSSQFALISSDDNTSFKMAPSRGCGFHRKKDSTPAQGKHLENKWKGGDNLTLCLTWTLAWIGWKGCALWKQCFTEDKIIWRNVTWDFKVEEKAVPQSCFLPRDVFYDVKGGAELSPKVMESKGKYFLNEKGSAFLKFSFTGLILCEPTLSNR